MKYQYIPLPMLPRAVGRLLVEAPLDLVYMILTSQCYFFYIQCIRNDANYGLLAENIKRYPNFIHTHNFNLPFCSSVGCQYEQKLRRILERRKIPFLGGMVMHYYSCKINILFIDEEFMRLQGYDKTPDFKISVPFG